MGKIETFDQFFDEVERLVWNTEQIFRPVEDWGEDDGDALFFKLDAGEPPVVTSPITSNWDDGYFTHWMPLPKELLKTADYRIACLKSGIETQMNAEAESRLNRVRALEIDMLVAADAMDTERMLDTGDELELRLDAIRRSWRAAQALL